MSDYGLVEIVNWKGIEPNEWRIIRRFKDGKLFFLELRNKYNAKITILSIPESRTSPIIPKPSSLVSNDNISYQNRSGGGGGGSIVADVEWSE